MVKKHDRVHT
ncbi:hypothetical protein D018_3110A, partial [Vibrio parahaemolyticus VP2007-007]